MLPSLGPTRREAIGYLARSAFPLSVRAPSLGARAGMSALDGKQTLRSRSIPLRRQGDQRLVATTIPWARG